MALPERKFSGKVSLFSEHQASDTVLTGAQAQWPGRRTDSSSSMGGGEEEGSSTQSSPVSGGRAEKALSHTYALPLPAAPAACHPYLL